MSGIGFQELVVLFVIGLLILGPERLPRVATQIGRWVGRARRTANQLRYQIEREIALADIEKKSRNKDETTPDSKPSTPSQTTEPGSGEAEAGDDGTAPQSAPSDEAPASGASDWQADESGEAASPSPPSGDSGSGERHTK